MLGPLTYLDVALLAIALVSGLLAMYRGLTREVLSILSWALAALATLYVVLNHKEIAEDLAKQLFQSVTLAQIVVASVTFIVTLIVVHFLTVRFSDRILDSRIGMVDRILGFAFGVVRGFLLVVIAYLFFEFLAQEKTHPSWIKEAQSLPYIKATGRAIRSLLIDLVPENLELPGRGGSEQESRAPLPPPGTARSAHKALAGRAARDYLKIKVVRVGRRSLDGHGAVSPRG